MRIDPVVLKRIGRAGAFALVGLALLAASVTIHRRDPAPRPNPVAPVVDPLAAELDRCRDIARPEDVDAACQAAWAEVRRRFFSTDHGLEIRP